MNPLTELAWFQALENLSDKDGRKAFRELARSTTFGDPEPAHILEIAGKHNQMWVNRDDGQNPWISKAAKFEGEKFEDTTTGEPTREYARWREQEQHKRYRAVGEHDEIFLIQNPEASDWLVKGGKINFIRPEPEATGTKKTFINKQGGAWKNQSARH